MSSYKSKETEQILDLLNNIDSKLAQNHMIKSQYLSSRNANKKYYTPKNTNIFSKNPTQDSYLSYNNIKLNQNNLESNNQLTDYELRKIIKEEFELLYMPHKEEINNKFSKIREEIHNVYEINNEKPLIDNFISSLNEIKRNLKEYVQQKINELEEKIDFKSSKNSENIMLKNEINYLNKDIQEVKNKFKEINNSVNIKLNEKNYDNNIGNETQIKNMMLQNLDLQKDFEKLREDLNNLKNEINNSILKKDKILGELEFKYNSMNTFESKYNKINNDLNKLKDSIRESKRINEEITNSRNFMNSYNLNSKNFL